MIFRKSCPMAPIWLYRSRCINTL